MISLKVKALFYRYTGVHTARKEESAYLVSPKGVHEIYENMKHWDMNLENATGLATGTWQAKYGFARPIWRSKISYRYKRLRNLVNWFGTLYLVVKWDLRNMVNQIFDRNSHPND